MVKATTPATGKPTATKPKAPSKAAAKAKATAATDVQETGAKAPVSLSVDKATGGDSGNSDKPPVLTEDQLGGSQSGPTGTDGQGNADDSADKPNAEAGEGDSTIDTAAPVAPAEPERQVPPGGFFSPIGRFPEGWSFQNDWKPMQTPPEEVPEEAVQFPAWGLPDIAEFPAELTLTNNTRNRIVVRHLNVHLPQFSSKTVICPTAEKYNAIGREFAGRAVRERWDSDKGLKVKHGEDQD